MVSYCVSGKQATGKRLHTMGGYQFGIFIEAYYSIKIGEKTHTFVWSRVIEGLVESCPQSLFQLLWMEAFEGLQGPL